MRRVVLDNNDSFATAQRQTILLKGIRSAKRPYWFYLTVLALLLTGAGFRLFSLPQEALDVDELFSRKVVLESLPAAYAEVRNDLVHPPLYYLLLKAGTSVWGASAFGLRFLSLLCGIASIGLIALLGSRLPGAKWCGLLAAAALAVGRYQIFYSQEARSYAFYSMIVLLLVLWVDAISQHERERRLWIAGAVLMLLLVYTHYYGAIYLFSCVLALLMCKLERRTKFLALLSAAVAALLLAPWIFLVLGVYRQRHGLGNHLNWLTRPGLQDLKTLWAATLGVGNFRGAGTLAFLLVLGLGMCAFVLVSKRESIRRSPTFVAIGITGILPPCVVFLLSNPPFNLPLFLLRHFLPSLTMLLLLSCYGLERLSQSSKRESALIAWSGAVLILALSATSTILELRAGPLRFPYYAVVPQVEAAASSGVRVYAASSNDSEPVNYYCGWPCVQEFPKDGTSLPRRLLLLYVPNYAREEDDHSSLLQLGYIDLGRAFYPGTAFQKMDLVGANLELHK